MPRLLTLIRVQAVQSVFLLQPSLTEPDSHTKSWGVVYTRREETLYYLSPLGQICSSLFRGFWKLLSSRFVSLAMHSVLSGSIPLDLPTRQGLL